MKEPSLASHLGCLSHMKRAALMRALSCLIISQGFLRNHPIMIFMKASWRSWVGGRKFSLAISWQVWRPRAYLALYALGPLSVEEKVGEGRNFRLSLHEQS